MQESHSCVVTTTFQYSYLLWPGRTLYSYHVFMSSNNVIIGKISLAIHRGKPGEILQWLIFYLDKTHSVKVCCKFLYFYEKYHL